MTQNKTALQEALDFFKDYDYENAHHLNALYKAAQTYADLPEKIEAMDGYYKPNEPEYYAYKRAKDDIINLLKEGV